MYGGCCRATGIETPSTAERDGQPFQFCLQLTKLNWKHKMSDIKNYIWYLVCPKFRKKKIMFKIKTRKGIGIAKNPPKLKSIPSFHQQYNSEPTAFKCHISWQLHLLSALQEWYLTLWPVVHLWARWLKVRCVLC